MPNLSNLAHQASGRSDLVASELADYQLKNGLDDAGLAARLGCSVSDLTRLRLCTLPRSDHFWDDVRRVAEYAGVDAVKLGDILAHVGDVCR